MTRPLKFRARHHVAGNWHYGFLVERNGKTFIFEQDGGQLREYQVDPKTVGQFTGLTDKNRKEIYDADLVSFLVENPDTEELVVVKAQIFWSDKLGGWYAQNLRNSLDIISFNQNFSNGCEAIGNIHENPELLK